MTVCICPTRYLSGRSFSTWDDVWIGFFSGVSVSIFHSSVNHFQILSYYLKITNVGLFVGWRNPSFDIQQTV